MAPALKWWWCLGLLPGDVHEAWDSGAVVPFPAAVVTQDLHALSAQERGRVSQTRIGMFNFWHEAARLTTELINYICRNLDYGRMVPAVSAH